MAIGEWMSVQSARELYQRQVRTEAAEIHSVPDEEQEELALIYEAKGLPPGEAQQVAERLMADEQTALDAHGPRGARPRSERARRLALRRGGSSFLLFAIGAIIPIIPYFVTSGTAALVASICCAAVGLFAIGALITLLTGRSVLFSGTRQLVFGLLAAGVTFGLGRLIGNAIGG